MVAGRLARVMRGNGRRREAWEVRVRLPMVAASWLGFVRLLDGRPVAEWARAVLLDALGRLLVERPGWAWVRPGAPVWREPAGGVLGLGVAPVAALQGGERVAVLALLPGCLPAGADPEGAGVGALVDVLPVEGEGGVLLRRVLVRAVDVLPWRPGTVGRGGALRLPMPGGAPGAALLEARAAEVRERERAGRERRRARASARGEPAAPAPGASTDLDGGSVDV